MTHTLPAVGGGGSAGRWWFYDHDDAPQEADAFSPRVGDFALSTDSGAIYKWAEPAPAPIVASVSPASGPPGSVITITGEHFQKDGEPYVDVVVLFQSGTTLADPYAQGDGAWFYRGNSGVDLAVVSDTELTLVLSNPNAQDWPTGLLGLHGVAVANPEGASGFLYDAFTLTAEA